MKNGSPKNSQIRVIGIDPGYSKPHAFSILRFSPYSYSHPRSHSKLILEDCGTITANSPFLMIENLATRLRWLELNEGLPAIAYVEDVYLGRNVQVMRKMAMMVGTIINFFERHSVECLMVENTKWERPLFKNVKYTEEYKRNIKLSIVKEDFLNNEFRENVMTIEKGDDVLDSTLIARYGALNYLQTYIKSMAV